ncbi:MAG TPA: ABC transporter substrate-binding protein [Candidatus Deferrimicrobiaceae bacterium]|nr:ABC transporter substrate-binding protein [Candidatus Deferrimicrobiaceae bacterium]
MNRRSFISSVTGGLLAAPLAAAAQPTRIGLLAHDLQPGLLEIFRDELQRLGYTEGRTITVEVRSAGGRTDRLPALAEDLLQLNVAVIVAVNTPAAKAAKKATSTIPIVIMRVADPVAQGLVKSLARPGGNVTGLSFMPDELGAKAVEVLHEILPGVTRVASLYKGDNTGALLVVTETERRSVQLGLRFVRLPVSEPGDFPGTFQTATRARAEALFVMDDGAITKHRKQLSELAAHHSLPVVSIYRDFAEAGGFIAYGPDLPTMYRSGAGYVDRILKGAKPADLPVEQPTKFDLVINLKTAKALGLTIPPSHLQRADRLIE